MSAALLNGTWYSTLDRGQCKPGQTVGVDCWWRIVEKVRNVNASCVNDRVVAAVQAERPTCWEQCPQPSNISTECWIHCLFETIVGNKTSKVPQMNPDKIVGAFEHAFDEKSGCPEVPPCPKPCKPTDEDQGRLLARPRWSRPHGNPLEGLPWVGGVNEVAEMV